jgi:hypothetical protein
MIVSIDDNEITWRKELGMFKVIILRPTLWTYVLEAYLQYAPHYSSALDQHQCVIITTGSRKPLTCCVEVGSGV